MERRYSDLVLAGELESQFSATIYLLGPSSHECLMKNKIGY